MSGNLSWISSTPGCSRGTQKEESLLWLPAVFFYWRQTFHITPFTNPSLLHVQRYLGWAQAGIPYDWFNTWHKHFPAQQSCFVYFSLCSFASWTFLAWGLLLSASISFLSANATADGECMFCFKPASPHFYDLFCSGDPLHSCTQPWSVLQNDSVLVQAMFNLE